MAETKTDPLQLARDEYRKLLTRTRKAEEEAICLRLVIDSVACIVNGDGSPEKLSDHPLVKLVEDQRRQPTEFMSEIMRLRNLLAEVILLGRSLATPKTEVWLRLLDQIRSELSINKVV